MTLLLHISSKLPFFFIRKIQKLNDRVIVLSGQRLGNSKFDVSRWLRLVSISSLFRLISLSLASYVFHQKHLILVEGHLCLGESSSHV